jgi:aldose 1-epimerase
MTYALTIRGLECHTTARNSGTQPLPYGVGHHPYFTVGADVIDVNYLLIPARSYFPTNERLIPILPSQSVEGTPFDFRTMHAINDVFMDTGFTDLIPDEDNFTRVKLAAPGGSPSVTVFMDATHQFLQVYTGDTLPTASERRRGIAIEPYTCAIDAFNNGLGLLVLKPGEMFTSMWGITAETTL